MPEIPNGTAAMQIFIRDNLRYPDEARLKKIEGTLVVKFLITNVGKLTKVNVTRGIGYGCDEEAVRVIQTMPD